MKRIFFIIIILISFSVSTLSQKTAITDKLFAIKLTENVYMHTSDNNNGMIYTNNGEALIVSTPWSDELTKELISWVQNQLKTKIVAYVIDRWHPDAMEGLDVVQKIGIKNYSYELTRTIARERGLPVPDIGFKPKLELKVGNEEVVCHYLGEAHTKDGIVVWVPAEKVLFGGNEIRSNNGWIGNIGNANLKEWSNTIKKVKKNYGTAKVVIPGHGKPGGVELIDYTIKLYTPNKWGNILRKHNIKRQKVFNDYDVIFEVALQDSVDNDIRILKEAIVFVDDNYRYIKVEASIIEHHVKDKIIKAPYGRLQIFEKENSTLIPTTDVYFKQLKIIQNLDKIGVVIILKEMI